MISFYSSQMVVTVNTTKYTIENDLTKKKKKDIAAVGTAPCGRLSSRAWALAHILVATIIIITIIITVIIKGWEYNCSFH